MITLLGTSAYSDFRIQKLLMQLQVINPSIKSISSRFVHLADVKEELNAVELNTLTALLTYGETEVAEVAANLWVFPRFGTISPWASKATDIA